MFCSVDDVLAILDQWYSGISSVRLHVSGPGIEFSFPAGEIRSVEGTVFTFQFEQRQGKVRCDIAGATCRTLDLAHELNGIPADVSRDAKQAIELESATGYRIVLVRLR
jgi:hypothetical protein